MIDAIKASARLPHIGCLRILMATGCCLAEACEQGLVEASEHGHTEVVEALLDRCAASEALDRAVAVAVRHGRTGPLRVLVRHCKVETTDVHIHAAVASGNPVSVAILYDRAGREPACSDDAFARGALVAASKGLIEIMGFFLSRRPRSVVFAAAAVYAAANAGRAATVRTLRDHGIGATDALVTSATRGTYGRCAC